MRTAAKALIGASILAVACSAEAPRTTRSWPTMGTYATVVVHGSDPAAAARAIDAVRAVLDSAASTMSNWSAASELSRLNRAAGDGPYAIRDDALASCIEASLAGAAATGGAFDPTVGPLMTAWGFRPKARRVPSEAELAAARARVGISHVRYDEARREIRFDREGVEIDLGGIGKGCALDDARRAIAGLPGIDGVDLDLGGQWAFAGGAARTAGIADPAARDRTIGDVDVGASESIATSSGSESPGHIMDPRTGRPADTDVVQATAIDPSATTVEILGKALMVAGSARAGEILARFPTARAILVVREGEGLAVLASASLDGRLRLARDARFSRSPRFTLPAARMPGSP